MTHTNNRRKDIQFLLHALKIIMYNIVQVVVARGCAYVVMVHRSDAVRALGGLKDNRIGGKVLCTMHVVQHMPL